MKELISQIFCQSIHALITAFFFSAHLASLTNLERLIIVYSFIPITKFIKTKVFQLTEGPAGQVAASGVGLASGLMSGAMKSATNKKGKGGGDDARGGHGGGSGGGGGTGEGFLSGAMDRTNSQQRSNATRNGTAPDMYDKDASTSRDSGYRQTYSSPTGGNNNLFKSGDARQRPSVGQTMSDAGDGFKEAFGKDGGNLGQRARTAGRTLQDMGHGLEERVLGSGARREANNATAGALVGAAGHMAAASVNAGMALGMGMVGENPTKYAEAAGMHAGKAVGRKVSGLYAGHEARRKGGLLDQQVMSMDAAGIRGIKQNGGFNRYEVNTNEVSSPQHQAIYQDLANAYSTQNGPPTQQETAMRQYYRDNYGITNVTMGDNGSMSVDMEAAKMQAHRISEIDPFEQMKAYRGKEGKK